MARPKTRIARAALVAAAALLAAPVLGAQAALVVGDFSAAPSDSGALAPWKLFLRAGKADFSLEREGPISALAMRSRDASFGFQREASASLDLYPSLSWKWKVSKLPEGGDYRRAAADDQAAQLYIAFSKTRIIGYIWDSSAPEGSSGDAASLPPFVQIKVIVLRSGAAQAGAWLEERRNLRQDYERLFGPAKGPLVVQGLRVQINSQHTGGEAACAFADISFSSP
jgi:hypothetical protein